MIIDILTIAFNSSLISLRMSSLVEDWLFMLVVITISNFVVWFNIRYVKISFSEKRKVTGDSMSF